MRRMVLAVLAPFAAFAQLGADRGSVIVESVSNVQTNWSFGKDIVTETEDGGLMDRRKVLVSAADAAAEAETAESVGRVSKAWAEGFARGTNELHAALYNLPTNGILVGLRFPLIPQTSRRFDIYVASNHYDSVAHRDELYVYFGQSFTNPPTMTVPYVWNSGMTTQRVAGVWTRAGTSDRYTNVWNVVEQLKAGPVTYPCHRLFVLRPPDLWGLPLNLNPHGRWGGPDGVAFGSYLLTVGGRPTFTGTVTNLEEGVVATFDNGAFVGLEPIKQEENQQ